MTDGKTTVVPGTINTYTITVTNNGPDTVSSLTLADTIPAALLNPNFAPSAGAYDTNTGAWSGLNLATGQSVTMTLTGTIDPNATGTISNTVTVAPPAGTTDTNSANDTATDNDTLTGPTDLSVTITNAATTLVPGSVDTYTITVANNGANTVSSFDLIDTIPDALLNATFGSPSAGSYDRGSGHWSNLSLANGQSVSITLSGVVGITTGTLATTVTVSAPAGMTDTNLGNNVATDTDTLVLFGSPYPPAPAATSANMLLRRGDGCMRSITSATTRPWPPIRWRKWGPSGSLPASAASKLAIRPTCFCVMPVQAASRSTTSATITSRIARFSAPSASIGRSWASAISRAAAKPT